MRDPAWGSEKAWLYQGDALEVLREMPDGVIQTCVTSPPYFGLRDYGVDGQVGAEETPMAYVKRLVDIFAEVRRVLADDGTLWLNLGDSYSGGNRSTFDTEGGKTRARGHAAARPTSGLPGKNLLGIPWRVAFALQDDGWILRNDIIWAKPNGMPESVTDRFAKKHEHLFLFSKSRRYWFDLDAIREDHTCDRLRGSGPRSKPGTGRNDSGAPTTSQRNELGKNPGDVWSISTKPFPEAHFATYPPELPERCVLAGSRPGDIVLDPFSGSGTTGMVALRHGRLYVGIELNPEYIELSTRTRLSV